MAARRKKPMYLPPTPPTRRTGWKDEKDSSTYYGERMRFTVHGSIHAPGKWFVSCPTLAVDRRELPEATGLEDAKVCAETYLTEYLFELAQDILHAIRTRRTGA